MGESEYGGSLLLSGRVGRKVSPLRSSVGTLREGERGGSRGGREGRRRKSFSLVFGYSRADIARKGSLFHSNTFLALYLGEADFSWNLFYRCLLRVLG